MAVDVSQMSHSSLSLTRAEVARLPFARRLRHPLYWAWVRFMVFGRATPATLFAFMGYLQYGHARDAIAAVGRGASVWHAFGSVTPRILYVIFCCIPVGLYLTRPMPAARDGRLVARSAAFLGTTMQLFVGAWIPLHQQLWRAPDWAGDVAGLMSIFALAFAIFSLGYLRRSLSIIPEARRLVTGGPYQWVRHPLYFAEITSAIALVLTVPYLTPLISLIVFIGMQNLRAHFEERLLRANFPEYDGYARHTRRLIPFVW
jgi:protein-S-isoprenylcysteine O-methyltransferase Ste14